MRKQNCDLKAKGSTRQSFVFLKRAVNALISAYYRLYLTDLRVPTDYLLDSDKLTIIVLLSFPFLESLHIGGETGVFCVLRSPCDL